MTAVVGIDPGAADTGIVVRSGDNPLAAEIVSRVAGSDDSSYIAEVLAAVAEVVDRYHAVVAVEGVVHPNPHVRITNISGLLGTAAVYGAVLARWPSAIVVPPKGNGKAPLSTYPEALRGPRERVGEGWRRHARSAWDVAGHATRPHLAAGVPA